MTVLVGTHPIFLDHDTGEGHPERPSRMTAVTKGMQTSELGEALVTFEPRPAERDELSRVHPINYIDALERFCRAGGGNLDPDTPVVPASWDAALRAAGAGLDAIERLRRGEADAAFCAVRPPGHHATPTRAMGFCLFNNVAVSAAALAAAGERVLIVDYDAHHGNGTQEAFYRDPNVLFVSLHQYPLYPGTGGLRETGQGDGLGTTVNFPLPAGATGDVYRRALEEVVVPLAERWGPTWVLVSAGFDGHRDDPITELGLAAGDYADLTATVTGLVPAGRRLVFLEGGYDLWAVVRSTAACLGALAGESIRPEPATNGGPGDEVVDAVARLHLGEG
ncbi:MAG: histone deacetylase family protein [Acidimicrobiia bacterium]